MVPKRMNNQCRSADSAVFLVMMRCGSHYSNVKNQAKSYISLNHVLFSSVSTKQLTSKPTYGVLLSVCKYIYSLPTIMVGGLRRMAMGAVGPAEEAGCGRQGRR